MTTTNNQPNLQPNHLPAMRTALNMIRMVPNLQLPLAPNRTIKPLSLTSLKPETLHIFHSFHWIYSNLLLHLSFNMHFLSLVPLHTAYCLSLRLRKSTMTQRCLRSLSSPNRCNMYVFSSHKAAHSRASVWMKVAL